MKVSMDRPRVYVDFNELVEDDLVLLSRTDQKVDSEGTVLQFRLGDPVHIYMDDGDGPGGAEFLIADGVVEPAPPAQNGWPVGVAWSCRIDAAGIRPYVRLVP